MRWCCSSKIVVVDALGPHIRGGQYVCANALKPALNEFAAALPTSRAIAAGDPALKSLHAASHRGLCSLHRVINSVDPEEAEQVFAKTIQRARELRELAS